MSNSFLAGTFPVSSLKGCAKTAVFVCCVLLLCGVRSAFAEDWVYTARAGDTLWNIAEEYTRDTAYWSRLKQLNQVEDPTKIPPGTRIRIPVEWLKYRPATAHIVEVYGDSQVLRAGTTAPQPAGERMELHAGDRLVTGVGGSVTVELADGSKLLVRSRTRVTLDRLDIFREGAVLETGLNVEDGAVDSRIERSAEGIAPRFRVSTPTAIAAVRGTDFRVAAEQARAAMRSETLAGTVEVTGTGKRRIAEAGFGIIAEAGKPPEPPRKLLTAPDAAQLPRIVEQVPVRFSWERRAGEAAYRVQLAPDRRFQKILLDQRRDQPSADLGALPDGEYALRLRAIDAVGLEGFDAVHAFTVNARPEPPVTLGPDDGGNVYTRRPSFRWAKPDDAFLFRFQLSSRPDLSRPLIDKPALTGNELELDRDLPLGRYYWRLATTDLKRERGPYGDILSFQIKEPPKAPDSAEAAVDEGAIKFRWRAVPDAVRYQFQLAEDREFQDVVIQRDVATNEIRLTEDELESGGEHFFRIRGVNQEGAAGAYSTVQAVDLPSKFSPLWFLLLPLVLIPILV